MGKVFIFARPQFHINVCVCVNVRFFIMYGRVVCYKWITCAVNICIRFVHSVFVYCYSLLQINDDSEYDDDDSGRSGGGLLGAMQNKHTSTGAICVRAESREWKQHYNNCDNNSTAMLGGRTEWQIDEWERRTAEYTHTHTYTNTDRFIIYIFFRLNWFACM